MSEFGEIVTPPDVERSVLAGLKEWSSTYLRLMERHTGRNLNALPDIASWRAADTMAERFPEQQIPACQVMIATDAVLDTQAQGMMGTFAGDIDVLVQSTEPERARELALLYAYAHGLLLLQQPQLDKTLNIAGMVWERIGAPAVGKAEGRWLALGTIHVVVAVQGIASPLAGPAEPIETEPPAGPQAEHTRVILEGEP